MIQKFIRLLSDSGFLLVCAAILAIIAANSPFAGHYAALWNYTPPIAVFDKFLTLQLWVNDLLMAVFFLLVGLEIKREIIAGELNSLSKAGLPIAAAIGGMIVPAVIFMAVNWHHPEYWRGWAIPSATDIAFSLAVLTLLGTRIPTSLKVFLTALAIIDDLGAIIIIAAFYTANLYTDWLGVVGLCGLGLLALNRIGVVRLWPYFLIGAVLWVAVLKSGIHATLAGVFLAAFIPIQCRNNPSHSPLRELEHAIHPYVAYIILPIFAFANSGLNLSGVITWESFENPLNLGIILGLFLGKQIGVFGASYAFLRGSRGRLPSGCGWHHIYGAAILAGIGFTMSLFIGGLAFADHAIMNIVRFGVITGSVLSAIAGYAVLCRQRR